MTNVDDKLLGTNPSAEEEGWMMAVLKLIEVIFDNWQFFRGESMNLDGMLALMDFRDDRIPF